MNTTSRRLIAGTALVLATTLFATGCIGVAPGDMPAPGQSTRFIVHPGFANTGVTLSDPADVNGNYRPNAVSRGTPREVRITWFETNPRGPNNLGFSRREQRLVPVRAANGSSYADITFPKNLCKSGTGSGLPGYVVAEVIWMDSTREWVFLPVTSGSSCRYI